MKGPGDYLKQMFSWFFINARPECPCEEHARQMNEWGPDGCEENLSTIIGWLEKEAKERKIAFSRKGARVLVKACIWAARHQRWAAPFRWIEK